MVLRIVKHELIKYSRDGQAKAMSFFVIFLIIASIVLSSRDYQLTYGQYRENIRQARLNWENQTEKDPHDAAHDGTYVIKPVHPLALLDKGIQQFSGKVVHLGAHERKQASLNEAKDHSGLFRFGELTPSFVLIYLIPLLMIFIGYRVITEEKERQTIRLLFSQQTTPLQLVMGKWLYLMAIVLLIWIIFFMIAGLSLMVVEREMPINLLEYISMAVINLLYFMAFTSVIVMVSARAKSSGFSLMTLLTIWIIVTLIMPKVSTNLAGSFYPFPTLQTFRDNVNQDQATGLNGHNFWNEAAQDFKQKVLDEYGVATVEDLPVAFGGLLLAEGEKYESEIYTKHFDLLQAQYEKQRVVYRWCGLISPLLPLRFVSMSLARSDYSFLWHFEDQAEKYRVDFNTVLNMNIAENAKGVEQYKAGSDLWGNVPEFQYQWQTGWDVLRDHQAELAIILLWSVFTFILMVFLGSKIKVS